ncbi:hypothetical protein [Natronogracilivirga saccharolytica]|uniref:Uncharacterized protein n=1 Tax=Natronogracilivirga saccharolytica TaxID=2812953 RepID=A0A8J7RNW6_9BACT|nr:hypothetical protein [Natronogracilivirga saccharolytica]MBP3193473.1 hypothetical protein [Natronogracilivirga saccharolytica]
MFRNKFFQAYSLAVIELIDAELDFFFLLITELIPKIVILLFEHFSELIDGLLIIDLENQFDQFEF